MLTMFILAKIKRPGWLGDILRMENFRIHSGTRVAVGKLEGGTRKNQCRLQHKHKWRKNSRSSPLNMAFFRVSRSNQQNVMPSNTIIQWTNYRLVTVLSKKNSRMMQGLEYLFKTQFLRYSAMAHRMFLAPYKKIFTSRPQGLSTTKIQALLRHSDLKFENSQKQIWLRNPKNFHGLEKQIFFTNFQAPVANW